MKKVSTASKAMRFAWSIFKLGFFKTFSEGLKAAWRVLRIQSGKPTEIKYVKIETGEVRTAIALQVGSLSTIELGYIRYVENIDGVFAWRAFRVQNMVLG